MHGCNASTPERRRSTMSLALSDYDYLLPEELIATRPLPKRQDSRMMVLHRREKRIEHRQFAELPGFLHPGDLLVLNNTKVVNARRFSDDGKIEFLFLEDQGDMRWKCLVRPGRKMRRGAQAFIENVAVRVEDICPDGERIVSFERNLNPWEGGIVPLPPYLRRQGDIEDLERYQTVYADAAGAVAAPTAGLHFTSEMLAALPHTFITLHVGAGTFQPVKTEDISAHQMHTEAFSISAPAAAAINAAQRVVAIGTTTVRVLESASRNEEGGLMEQGGATAIFIHPPTQIRYAGALLTNFHLPRSTLLMLVSAFAGREFVLRAYEEAIQDRYRFYSYGDCMLIL
jgi:S-adenosylmethionine:tRNA ribosyltransferase-isomerase